MSIDRALIFGVIGLVLNCIGYAPYIRGIFAGTVKPQRITWGIWTILVGIPFINQVHNGGGYSSYFFGSVTVLTTVVFVLSITRGVGGRSGFDVIVLIAAVILFIVWALTRDTRITTIIAVTIDGVAALPTLVKAYKYPQTEVYLQWVLAACGGFFGMLALPRVNYILLIYPVYVITMNSSIAISKFFGERKDTSLNSESEL
ncbi:MAG TPA: hypothetical protein PKB15_00475 [Acidimicrobiia bacterium]|nr:hypothetical protein [Acidimicrobiia bacterium]